MLFDTPVYIVFLAVVVLLYWKLNRRQQNIFLLIASYFFYGWWDWRFLILIWTSTLVDFYCARYVARSSSPARRRALLSLSVALNLGFLGFFKYFDFFIGSFSALLDSVGLHVNITLLRIVLPPGISFYTFQALAYIIDVYHRKLEPAESLLDYALFICLFPHLIAGPIQRPSHLLPQVQKPRRFDADRFFSGLMLIVMGLFRKCFVADNCGLLAAATFDGRLGEPSVLVCLLGTWAFAWQIYADFSGYSDIARGSAQLLGFHFIVNFRQPYLSRSLQEFWRRWHISLSTWLRDYLYIPLGGSRHGEPRTLRNLMTTMLLGGLWHGANWTFVVWGGIHGVGLAVGRVIRRLLGREETAGEDESFWSATAWIKRIVVFQLVCVSWVFFRATSMGHAFHLLGGLGRFEWRREYFVAFEFLTLCCLPLFVIDLVNERRGEEYLFERAPDRWRIATAMSLLMVITLFGANQVNDFIYFRF